VTAPFLSPAVHAALRPLAHAAADEACDHSRSCGCRDRAFRRYVGVVLALVGAGWTVEPPGGGG